MNVLRETIADAGRAGLDLLRHPRRRAEDRVRPDHRPHGLGAAARVRRGLRHRVHQRGPRRLSEAVAEFETTVPGIYVIGALAGYPLIKHCMNQGYDVVEFINGNTELKPADEPILREEVRASCRASAASTNGSPSCAAGSRILNELSLLQMREFMLDSEPRRPIAPATSSSSATIPARRCSRSPTARSLVEVDPDRSRRSPCRSRRARSSARSA